VCHHLTPVSLPYLIIQSSFRPAWWLKNGHAQTLWPSLFRPRPDIPLTRERLELADGDFLDLDWGRENSGPLVLILHGLEGNDQSHYTRTLLKHLSEQGLHPLLMYFRGCSGEANRLPYAYHSGETGDLAYVIQHLMRRYPHKQIYAVGFSLGGNVLLKWLGETGRNNPLAAAAAVSVPFVLENAADKLNRGISRLYQHYLMGKLHQSLKRKIALFDLPVDIQSAMQSKTIRAYDDLVTAPLHHFRNADDYYRQSSSRRYLHSIAKPTLIIHAEDDPFMTKAAIPVSSELSKEVILELSTHGGHVGFITGRQAFKPVYWLEQRLSDYFLSFEAQPTQHRSLP